MGLLFGELPKTDETQMQEWRDYVHAESIICRAKRFTLKAFRSDLELACNIVDSPTEAPTASSSLGFNHYYTGSFPKTAKPFVEAYTNEKGESLKNRLEHVYKDSGLSTGENNVNLVG